MNELAELRDFIENGCDARPEDRHHALQQLDSIAAALDGVRVPGWIPVSERLPPTMIPVLTTNGVRVTQTYRTGDNIKDASSWGAWAKNQVTHWMPLPEPPLAAAQGGGRDEREADRNG